MDDETYEEIMANLQEIDEFCDDFWAGLAECETPEEEYQYCLDTYN